jgi:hypothetical protein
VPNYVKDNNVMIESLWLRRKKKKKLVALKLTAFKKTNFFFFETIRMEDPRESFTILQAMA